MTITASMVKELRERSGAGMMDCKNVLQEVDGDMEKAINVLREKGLAKAAKKIGRVASEGLVRVQFSEDGTKAGIVEVNSETDFVAKNESFIEFVDTLAYMAVDTDTTSLEDFLNKSYGDVTVKTKQDSLIATIGENISFRRFAHVSTPGVKYVGYLHGAGKIGVLVGIKTDAAISAIQAIGRDVAMQVASMNPKFVDESQVDPEFIENEKEILIRQALNEGKPANIVEKMVVGRLKKELKETCLLEQSFVKNADLSVAEHVEQQAKAIGSDLTIVEMVRFEVGEGIEKREENFAEEVAKQING